MTKPTTGAPTGGALRSAEDWAEHWEQKVSPYYTGKEDYLSFLRAVQQDALASQRAEPDGRQNPEPE